MNVRGDASTGIFPIARLDDQKVSCGDARVSFADLAGYLLDSSVTWQPAAPDALASFVGAASSAAQNPGANDNNADPAVTVVDPAPPGPATTGSTGQVVFAWVQSFDAIAQDMGIDLPDLHAASVLTGEYGRVMLTRFTVVHDSGGMGIGLSAEGTNVVRLASLGADKSAPGTLASANDNVVWVGDEGGTGLGGAIGRDAQAVALVTGDTIVTWVDLDGNVNGKAYAANDLDSDAAGGIDDAPRSASSTLTGLLADIAHLAPDQRYRLVESGRDGFAVLWAATLAGAVVLQGRHFSLPDDQGGQWQVSTLNSAPLASGFEFKTDFQVLGWSAEDGVVTVSYEIEGTTGPVVQSVGFEAGVVDVSYSSSSEDGGSSRPVGSSSSFVLSLQPGSQLGSADSGATTEFAPTVEAEFASLHAGIVDVAGTGGRLLIGDTGITGTPGDDIIIGDLPDSSAANDGPIAGDKDRLAGEDGDDVFYGGGDDDQIDGGDNSAAQASEAPTSVDTAIFTGDSRDYSITANGDGSFTVVLAKSDTGSTIDRGAAGFEGVDTTKGIEQNQFLNGDIDYVTSLANGADIGTLDTSGHGVVRASDVYHIPDRHDEDGSGGHDGTLSAWGLSRDGNGDVENTIDVASADAKADASADLQAPVASATGNGGFAVGWIEDGSLHVAMHDELGRRDSNSESDTSFGPIDTAVVAVMDASGEGVAVAYSSATPGSDLSDDGATIVVQVIGHDDHDHCDSRSDSHGATIEVDGAVTGLAVAGGDAGGMISVAWAETSTDATDDSSEIVIQRFDAADHSSGGDDREELEATGLDGRAGEGSDATETIGAGRAPAITDTADDGFAVAWIGESATTQDPSSTVEAIEGRIFDSVGLVVESFTIPVGDGRHLREGTGPTLETTGNGDLFISWQETDDNASGLAVMSALLRELGPSEWSSPIIRELRHFDDGPGEISVAVAGENGDAIVVTWRHDGEGGGEIVGQRYSIEAIAEGSPNTDIGLTFEVAGASHDGGRRDSVSVTGLDDGRVVVVSREIDRHDEGQGTSITVQAAILDTRDPNEILISTDQGAGQDSHVGTIGDDIIDGRASQDELHGALGNDVLTGGTGDDRLDGGEDDDTLLGGSGSDRLDGGDGDDLLMGGFGRDYISGGDGEDTLSYRGETRRVTVDLATGIVYSEATHNAVVTPSTDLEVRGISTAVFFDANVEDVLGRLESTNCGSDGSVEFHAGHDIENIEGGLGSDTLLGDRADNVLTGGKGDDVLDGRDGDDTAAFSGNSADYDFVAAADGGITVRHVRNTTAAVNDGADTLRNIESASFADGKFGLRSDGTLSAESIAEAFGIASEISVAAIDCFDFADLDDIDRGSTSSGSGSGCAWRTGDAPEGLCGLGSDTLYFGDLDALSEASVRSGSDHDDLFDSDGLDYSSCTILAAQAEIEAALCLDGPDSLDAMTTTDDYNYRSDKCDPTEFRIG